MSKFNSRLVFILSFSFSVGSFPLMAAKSNHGSLISEEDSKENRRVPPPQTPIYKVAVKIRNAQRTNAYQETQRATVKPRCLFPDEDTGNQN